MKTVLDLIREFGALNDAKARCGGSLAAADEKRWAELKAFYDLLMSEKGLKLDAGEHPFSASEIRERLTDRERLRVPAPIYAILDYHGECHPGRLVNLSRGGAFVASQTLFEIGSRLSVHLARVDTAEGDVFDTVGDVVWRTERGVPEADLPRGMGIRFVFLDPALQDKLDSLVIEMLEKQLSGLW